MKALNVHQFQDYHKHAVEEVEPSPMKAGHVRIDIKACLLYTSPSPRDLSTSRMPSSA